MLKEIDIDTIVNKIREEGYATVYYIAHSTELREGYIDEMAYKSVSDFEILQLKVDEVQNAYWEYQNFIDNPNQYHSEEDLIIVDHDTKYTRNYTVRNALPNYTKEFNPRMPSAIYGRSRKLYRHDVLVGDYNDPSPVKPVYTNAISYLQYDAETVLKMLNANNLDWKYKVLESPVQVDNIKFKYLTSDWYVLNTPNYPRTEKHLICTKHKTAFFLTTWQALNYLDELEA